MRRAAFLLTAFIALSAAPALADAQDGQVQAMRDAWSAEHRLVLVTGNAKIPVDDKEKALAEIKGAYEKSRAIAVTRFKPIDSRRRRATSVRSSWSTDGT